MAASYYIAVDLALGLVLLAIIVSWRWGYPMPIPTDSALVLMVCTFAAGAVTYIAYIPEIARVLKSPFPSGSARARIAIRPSQDICHTLTKVPIAPFEEQDYRVWFALAASPGVQLAGSCCGLLLTIACSMKHSIG